MPDAGHGGLFDRSGSTLGVMDDLQVAVHTYDGCSKGCPGCLVDKHFKNKMRFENILSAQQMELIQSRVEEYYQWTQEYLNQKEHGYFGKHPGGFSVDHYSYTFRFGNHSELPLDELVQISEIMQSEFRVFSTAPMDEIHKFAEVRKRVPGRYFLEIIYDPVADDPQYLHDMIMEMRRHDIMGYPEVLITKRLLEVFTPEKFVEEAIGPLGEIGTQMQFGRYSPAKTRGFRTTQVVPVDEEVEWLTAVTAGILKKGYDLHPIPIGEYAVTFLDEYGEANSYGPDGRIDESLLPEPEPFNIENVREKTRDIFLSSIYIDHNLDVNVWSESMGQHVLDVNFGYGPVGNIVDRPIHEIMMEKGGVIDKMLNEVLRNLMTHRKCAPCRYKSFCASHAIPLFRKWHDDNGKHCYGYLPVILEFQTDHKFLRNMIDGFKELEF
ncbi:MAG: hypothetical protein Alpg2KO_32980 [Alphaproteobacteria bacterium]